MLKKLILLKEYIAAQAEREELWFIAEIVTEHILQEELRKVAWMIEDATPEQIANEIEKLKNE